MKKINLLVLFTILTGKIYASSSININKNNIAKIKVTVNSADAREDIMSLINGLPPEQLVLGMQSADSQNINCISVHIKEGSNPDCTDVEISLRRNKDMLDKYKKVLEIIMNFLCKYGKNTLEELHKSNFL